MDEKNRPRKCRSRNFQRPIPMTVLWRRKTPRPLRIARPGAGGHCVRGARAAGALARCLRFRRSRYRHRSPNQAGTRWNPLQQLHAQNRSRRQQSRRAPSGPQCHPAANQSEGLPSFALNRNRHFVQRFSQFTSALRQQCSRAIQFIRCLRKGYRALLKRVFLCQQRATIRAICQMRLKRLALSTGHLVTCQKHQQWCRFRAIHFKLTRAHRSSPNSSRNFRVARNSEFFTVSSVVPNASPIARNFNPW